MLHQVTQSIKYEALRRHPRQSAKTLRNDQYLEVAATTFSALVARVKSALVDNSDVLSLK
jgi:hypothetical protein